MSMVLVQTPLSQSVAVLVAAAQRAPKLRGAGPDPASSVGEESFPEQAPITNDKTRTSDRMAWYPTVAPPELVTAPCDRYVTACNLAIMGRQNVDRSPIFGDTS